MKKRKNNKIKTLILFGVGLLLIAELCFLLFGGFLNEKPVLTLEAYALSVREKCMGSKYKPSCYDKEIPKLMDYISMEDAFKVTKLIQAKDREYTYCHVLGHNLSGRETKKDPSKWAEVISRCPTTICNNGCLHGPLLEVYKSETLTDAQIEDLLPKISTVCEARENWEPLLVETSMCYHGIGHLAMYITNADIDKSIEICRKVAVKKTGEDNVLTCIQGIFMQVFQPLEPEDVALVKGITPDKKDVEEFCSEYGDLEKGACYREAWPLFDGKIGSAQGATEYCSYLSYDPHEERRCFSGLMSINTVRFLITQNNREGFYNYCVNLPFPHDKYCFSDAAMRFVQIDPVYVPEALSVCALAKNDNYKDYCYQELVLYAKRALRPNSKEYMTLCDSVPSRFAEECRAGLINSN